MSWRCSVPGCGKRNQAKAKDVVIHRFPEKDLELCSKWLAAIGRDGTKTERKYASLRVCSQHFSPDDYQRDLKAELLGCPPKKVLKKTAIPTIFHTKRKQGRRPSQTLNKTQPQVKQLFYFLLLYAHIHELFIFIWLILFRGNFICIVCSTTTL